MNCVFGVKSLFRSYGVLRKRVKHSSASGSTSLTMLCRKVEYFSLEDSIQNYQDKFLYKLVDPEYFFDNSAEAELKTKFLKLIVDNNLLSFIRIKRNTALIIPRLSIAILNSLVQVLKQGSRTRLL